MDPLTKTPESIFSKFSRECELFAGAAGNLCDGIKNAAQDAWSHPEKSTKMVADAAACGLAIALIAKNPAILGKGLQPVCEFGMAHGGEIGAGLVSIDLSQRMADPIAATWRSPDSLAMNKQDLGNRLGSVVVDYTLMGAGGLAGGKYGPASLQYFGDFMAFNFRARPSYALAGTAGAGSFTQSVRPFSTPLFDNPSTKDLVLFKERNSWREITLTGKTHLAKPGQTSIEGERGDIVLHTPESGKNYIGVKLLDDSSEPNVITNLNDFDIRDVIAKAHVNYKSESHRLLNLQVIQEAVSNLIGELALRRDTRHHTVDSYDDLVQYRLRSPLWLDPTIWAPKIELPLSGRLTEFEPVRPRKGDLYLSHELDQVGAQNKYLGNGPQSGMFTLNIYDDQLWLQKFNLRNFLSYHTDIKEPSRLYRFWTKYEMLARLPNVVETLQPFIKKDDLSIWNHNPKKRMFET